MLLSVRGLHKTYRRGRLAQDSQRALNGVDLSLEAGSCVALVGPSASGKSTLAKCIAGWEKPDHGEIRLAENACVQLIPQNAGDSLNPRFTAAEIIGEPMRIHGERASADVRYWMQRVGLPPARERDLPAQFSGGERVRLAIARALAAAPADSPTLLIFDESFSSLDVPLQDQILDLLRELQKQLPLTYLLIVHDLTLAKRFAGQIVTLCGTGNLLSHPVRQRARGARSLIQRATQACLLLVGVSILSFLLLALSPGDYFDEARMRPQTSPDTIARLREDYGLSRPLPVRYARWLTGTLRGEFGVSHAYNQPVAGLLAPRLRNTLLLTLTSMFLAWGIALPLGVWAAKTGRWADRLASLAITLPLAIPELVLGGLLVYWAARTGWLPAGGMTSASSVQALDVLRHAILPVLVLTIGALPLLVRHVRATMREAANAPFVRAAESLGIGGARLWFRHILPAAANPLISLWGLSIAGLLSSSLLVETIFGWPGLGPLFLEAVLARDTYLVLAPVMCSATLLIAANFMADVLLYAADPRIRKADE